MRIYYADNSWQNPKSNDSSASPVNILDQHIADYVFFIYCGMEKMYKSMEEMYKSMEEMYKSMGKMYKNTRKMYDGMEKMPQKNIMNITNIRMNQYALKDHVDARSVAATREFTLRSLFKGESEEGQCYIEIPEGMISRAMEEIANEFMEYHQYSYTKDKQKLPTLVEEKKLKYERLEIAKNTLNGLFSAWKESTPMKIVHTEGEFKNYQIEINKKWQLTIRHRLPRHDKTRKINFTSEPLGVFALNLGFERLEEMGEGNSYEKNPWAELYYSPGKQELSELQGKAVDFEFVFNEEAINRLNELASSLKSQDVEKAEENAEEGQGYDNIIILKEEGKEESVYASTSTLFNDLHVSSRDGTVPKAENKFS